MFTIRNDAGRKLAAALTAYRGRKPLVLGLPRGGVVVAAEVARALEGELDVLFVKKLGAPDNPELAVGAVGE
ncbi:MAG: phosphoribosyltransferase, partial [Verrucomicrobia bacterium]|nr:phosphoribosyltransferase [Verrucomicrobiota bacterium]